MKVSALLALYDRWLTQHRSESTRATYAQRLKPFGEAFGTKRFDRLTAAELLGWLLERAAVSGNSTQRLDACVIESLQTFALQNKIIGARIVERFEKPRGVRREILPTEEQTRRIFAAGSPQFRRIYSALRQSGARPGELCNLQIGQVFFDLQLIRIAIHKTARKTGKPREIPIGAKLEAILRESIGRRQLGPVFLTPRGRPWTSRMLAQTFYRIRKGLGLPSHLVPYLARHEAGTQICRKIGIEQARQVLGHSSIQTTQRYMHLETRELAAAVDSIE